MPELTPVTFTIIVFAYLLGAAALFWAVSKIVDGVKKNDEEK